MPSLATQRSPDLVEAMKVYFAGPMYNNVVSDSEFLKFIKANMEVKVDTTTGGRYIERSAKIRNGGGDGARAENDYLPEARRPKFLSPRINLRKLQVTVDITGETLRLVRGSTESFVNWAEMALPDATERFTHHIDRQYIGTGAAILARVTSKDATGVVIEDAFGVQGFTNPWLLFMEGDSIVFASDAAGTTLRNVAGVRHAMVSDINEDTGKLTLKSADDTAVDAALLTAIVAQDYIFKGDAAGTNAPKAGENREIEGVLAGVDDGGIVPTYHNVTRAGNRLFQGNVLDVAAAPLTEDVIIQGDEKVSVRGGGRIDHLVLSFAASRGYWKDLKGSRSINDPRGDYTGGKGKLEIVLGDRVLTFNIARKLPPELAFGLQKDTWERYTPGALQWDDATGDIWNRATDATGRLDAYYAVANMHENMDCKAPRKNIRFEDIDPTP